MQVKLISVTPDAEKIIGYCARVSSPDNQDNPDYAKLLKYCLKHSHFSVFEMANLTLELNTNRGISPQLLRHTSFSFQEYSQRYAAVDETGIEIIALRRQDKKDRQNSIDDMSKEFKKEFEQDQLENWKRSFEYYNKWLVREGAKEVCRTFLPLGTKTKLYINGSVRSWITYLLVRMEKSTQLEHRLLAEECWKVFQQQLPIISEACKKTYPEVFI